MAGTGSNRKVANSLVAVSSAAVLAVYSAGYVRTRSVADRLADHSLERNVVAPAAPEPPTPIVPSAPARATRKVAKPAQPPRATASVQVPAPEPPSPDPPPSIAPTEAAPKPAPLRDGKYVGWGNCRHGDIQATVVVDAGRIVSAEISDCQTRYPCDVIDKLPGQVVTRQSPNVQRVSGATESADAFYWAVVEALKQAR